MNFWLLLFDFYFLGVEHMARCFQEHYLLHEATQNWAFFLKDLFWPFPFEVVVVFPSSNWTRIGRPVLRTNLQTRMAFSYFFNVDLRNAELIFPRWSSKVWNSKDPSSSVRKRDSFLGHVQSKCLLKHGERLQSCYPYENAIANMEQRLVKKKWTALPP